MPIRTEVLMGTIVTIHLVSDVDEGPAAIERAFGWFREIEAVCTRFDPASELRRLCTTPARPVVVSPILFEAVRFAVTVAEDTGGGFDPTVGAQMAARGFTRDYRSALSAQSSAPDTEHSALTTAHSYRDVQVDAVARTITLARPLTLDLGAIAKGLAVDAAARELRPFTDFAIDAGGDLYLGGHNPAGAAWSVGIRHPRRDGELIDSVCVSNRAVCTSGDYERGDHVVDPRTGASPTAIASVTVAAPAAMLADALATAAFVLGPVEGIGLLERHGVEGLIVTPGLDRFETAGWRM